MKKLNNYYLSLSLLLSLQDYFVSVETLLMPKMQKKLLEKK